MGSQAGELVVQGDGVVVVAAPRPPVRRRRWGNTVAMSAVLLATVLPNAIRILSEGENSVPFGSIVTLIAWGGIFWVALIWWFYRPGRRLYRAMVKAHPDLRVVPIYSSDELISAMRQLKGTRLASSALPSGAYLVFIDAGRQFGLWRIRHGRAQPVIQLPWSAVHSVDVGTISHLTIEDRAVMLNAGSGERMVRIPISPQERRALRITPVDDGAFDELLAQLQLRVATSRAGGDGQPHTPAAEPSRPLA